MLCLGDFIGNLPILTALYVLRSVSEWWPLLQESDEKAGAPTQKAHLAGLYVHRQGRPKGKAGRRKGSAAKKVEKKTDEDEAEKEPMPKQKKKEKKLKKKDQKAKKKKAGKNGKKKIVRLKKEPKPKKMIPEDLKHFNRTSHGALLVRQIMDKIKAMDEKVYPGNLLFDPDSQLCKLQIENCEKMPWSTLADAAHPYFKTLCLG